MAEANIVADRPHNREMHHHLNRKGIPWMDLTDLSLADIVETVSHAKKLDQLPPDCRPPSTLSSTMSRPLMPRRIPISSSTSTLSRLARLAASRIPISALKCPQSSTNGLSTSTQGGRDTQDAFQSMQESSMTPREEIAAKYMGVGASFEYTETKKVMEKEVPLSESGGMPKKVSFARSISVRVCSPSTQRSSMIHPTPPCSTLPRIVPLSQMEYTRSASVSTSINYIKTTNIKPICSTCQINASPPASPHSSKPTVASRFPKRFPLSQGKYTSCPSALSPSLTGQSASAPGRRSSGQPVDNKDGANPPDYKSPSRLSGSTSRPLMPRRIPITALKCPPSSTDSQYRKLDKKGNVDNSLPLRLQVENKSIEGSRREDNDAIILSRRSKFKSIEGVLVKSKVYLAGNFNVNLSNLTQKIELSGGIVINEIAGADIVVVGDQPRDEDIQSMSKTITPWTDLDLLYKVMEMEESLLDIIGKPSKVSLAEKPNKQPLAYICGYVVPKRCPLSQRKYTGSPSALSLPLTGQSASAQGRRGSGQSDNNKSGATVQNPIFKHHTILTATKPTSNTSESLSSSPISANPKPTISSPSAKSSYSLSQSTQKRGRGIQAKTSHSIYKGGRAVKIQRLWRSLKQQIRVRISHRIQQSRLLHQISKHTKQVKAKQLQSNRGCNHRPPPILFETSIGSNDSNHNFLQHSFCHKQTRRGKHKTPCCRTGCRHTPNAPPDSDREGVPWGTSDATDKSINYTNFSLHHITAGYLRRQEEKNLRKTARELASLDPNNIPAGSHYLLKIDIESTEQSFSSISYWVLAMKAAQQERFIKQKRNQQQRRRDGMYGRNWTPITTLQAAVSTGKRDHSSMVAAPQRQQLKRTTEEQAI